MGKKSFGVLSVLVLVFSMLAPFALAAEEVTRESYAEAVEPICKTNTQANEKILKGVRSKFKSGQLGAAATQFAKASQALKKTVKQLKTIAQPTADQAKLTKWLKYVEEEANLFQLTANKLKQGNKAGAQAMVIRLTHNANQANNQVLGFEFHYCRFEPSKFT